MALNVKFGTGSIHGHMATDDFHLGPLHIKKQSFAEITEEDGEVFVTSPLSGIMGLAYPVMAAHHLTPVFDQLMQQKVVEQMEFAFYFSQHANGQASCLTLGGVDPTLYTGKNH
jgi:hypothetical protein